MIIFFTECSQIFGKLWQTSLVYISATHFQEVSDIFWQSREYIWVEEWSGGDSLCTWWLCPVSRLYFCPVHSARLAFTSDDFTSEHPFLHHCPWLSLSIVVRIFLLFLIVFILFPPKEAYRFSFFRTEFHKFSNLQLFKPQLFHHKWASLTKWSLHDAAC